MTHTVRHTEYIRFRHHTFIAHVGRQLPCARHGGDITFDHIFQPRCRVLILTADEHLAVIATLLSRLEQQLALGVEGEPSIGQVLTKRANFKATRFKRVETEFGLGRG